MAFFGGNPSMMNGALYQQLLAQMQGSQGSGLGGPGIGMSAMPNMAPNIAQQQRQPTSNISQIPQTLQPQRQQNQPQGGQVGAAVQAGDNMQKLYGMGNDAYKWGSGMMSPNTPPNAPQGPYAAGQTPGQGYGMGGQMPLNPQMNVLTGGQPPMGSPGLAPSGAAMQTSAGSQAGQPFFGGMQNPMSGMYGAGGMPAGAAQGTMANFAAPTGASGSTFGSMGGAAGAAGTAGQMADASATAAGTGATGSSMPAWLSSLLDAL